MTTIPSFTITRRRPIHHRAGAVRVLDSSGDEEIPLIVETGFAADKESENG